MELIMPLAHSDLRTFRCPLVPGQWRFSANWSSALIVGGLLLAPLNSHGRKMQVWLLQANPIRSIQTRHKSHFNGIMLAPRTGPAHLFVVEQEEAADQTT
jgi:hypothetical protein